LLSGNVHIALTFREPDMKAFLSSLNTRMGLLFLSFFLLIAVSVGATAWVVETQKVDARVINLAGRQRMLIQQMTREAALIESDPVTRQSLSGSIDTFDRTLDALAAGGAAPYLPNQEVILPATRNREILAQLDRVEASWGAFKDHLEALMAEDEDGQDPAEELAAIEALSPALLAQMDAAVRMYESASREKVERLRWIQASFFLSAIVLLAAGIILIRNSVISPLKALARGAARIGSGDLSTRLKVSGPSEIEALTGRLDAMRLQLLRAREGLEHRVEKRTRELAALHEVSREITSRLEIEHVLQSVAEKARELLGCETAFICLYDRGNQSLRLHAMSGPKVALGEARVQVQDPHTELVLGGREAVFCNGVECSGTCNIIAEPYHRSHLAASMRTGDKVVGALCAASPQPGVFSSEDADILTKLADSAAVALENARLYQQAERAATLEERHRIAAEIHDGLAQILSYLELEVEELFDRVQADLSPDLERELLSIREAVAKAGLEARESIQRLHEQSPAAISLQGQVEKTLRAFSGSCDFEIEFDPGKGPPLELPPHEANHLLRIILEALNNAQRHANPSRVAISLDRDNGTASLTIEDDGVGFEIDAPPQDDRAHFGLSIMRARAKRLDGDLRIDSELGSGTRILLAWPTPSHRTLEQIEPVKG
jgi:two-component system nitrate/nitrite sensor histidine kinase NarX